MTAGIIMCDGQHHFPPQAFLKLQTWLSPAFPIGSYSYSHGLEKAIEAGDIQDRKSLVDWLNADICYGSARNEAIFFGEAWRCATDKDGAKLFKIANLRPLFAAHRNLRLNHRSRRPHASRWYAKYGPIAPW